MITSHCCVCGTIEDLEVHHVVPTSLGGSDNDTNKITVCSFHHGVMHDTKRNSLSTLTKKGIKKARDKGVEIGRPKGKQRVRRLDVYNDRIVSLLNDKLSLLAIANDISVAKTTLHDHIKARGLSADNPPCA